MRYVTQRTRCASASLFRSPFMCILTSRADQRADAGCVPRPAHLHSPGRLIRTLLWYALRSPALLTLHQVKVALRCLATSRRSATGRRSLPPCLSPIGTHAPRALCRTVETSACAHPVVFSWCFTDPPAAIRYRQTPANDLQYWGLDYPPLTAYHSFIAGKVCVLCAVLLCLAIENHTKHTQHNTLTIRQLISAPSAFARSCQRW